MAMALQAPPSTFHLFLRALMPSPIGLVIYLLVGLGMVAAHTVSLSTSGVAYPNSTNDTFMLFYANHIVQPVASALNSSVLANGMTILLWGLCGLLTYALIAGLAGGIARWRETEHDVRIPQEGVVERHPLERSMLVRAAWRLLIAIAIIAFTIAIIPLVHWCLVSDERLLQANNLITVLRTAGITTAAWMLVMHGYLVLLRLYLLRTRVFGELLY